jgi:predicted nucleic acid-binding protein
MIIIDASLAVKWYLAEVLSEAAVDLLLEKSPHISVPDTFCVEVTSALVREANIDKAKSADARNSITRFKTLCEGGGIRIIRTTPDALNIAADLAINLGHPLKDCIYLALAMELDCELITADACFAAKARGVWGRVRVLGE